MGGKCFLGQQLQTGKFELPSMSGALKDSGAINFSLEEDEDKKVEDRVDSETTSNERMGTTQNATTLNCVTIHDRMQACLPLMTKLDFHLFRISFFIYLFNVGINEYWSVKICANLNKKRFPLYFVHTLTVILPSVTQTLNNSTKFPLTRSNFCFPSHHFY